MKKNILTVLAVLVVAAMIAGCQQAQPSEPAGNACTREALVCPDGSTVGREGPNCEFAACPDGKRYVGTSAEQCQTIRFVCNEGEEYFSDDNGCGCAPAGMQPEGEEQEFLEYFPNPYAGPDTACTEQYDPVCGWSNSSIQCFAYPCAQTFGNACEASRDPSVDRYTLGECPKVGSAPSSLPTRNYISTDTEQCAAMMFLCVEGMEPFFNEKGCGCQEGTRALTVACGDERPEACTKEYMPVCGSNGETYGNSCTACADETVAGYTKGACEVVKLKATDCTDPRPEMCTMQYDPVCGQKADGTTQTYGNACGACSDASVISHVPGEC